MQRVRPMDRLLCGDVGFGKTEVAFNRTNPLFCIFCRWTRYSVSCGPLLLTFPFRSSRRDISKGNGDQNALTVGTDTP